MYPGLAARPHNPQPASYTHQVADHDKHLGKLYINAFSQFFQFFYIITGRSLRAFGFVPPHRINTRRQYPQTSRNEAHSPEVNNAPALRTPSYAVLTTNIWLAPFPIAFQFQINFPARRARTLLGNSRDLKYNLPPNSFALD